MRKTELIYANNWSGTKDKNAVMGDDAAGHRHVIRYLANYLQRDYSIALFLHPGWQPIILGTQQVNGRYFQDVQTGPGGYPHLQPKSAQRQLAGFFGIG